jgi:hypothetical protein
VSRFLLPSLIAIVIVAATLFLFYVALYGVQP